MRHQKPDSAEIHLQWLQVSIIIYILILTSRNQIDWITRIPTLYKSLPHTAQIQEPNRFGWWDDKNQYANDREGSINGEKTLTDLHRQGYPNANKHMKKCIWEYAN